ncbi:MAG: PD-(D/E)XK nuclease family protein, partial [Acetomicrobium sp.]
MELPTVLVDAVSFVGRADRIDCLNEKGQILWDYKTGGSHNYESSLQLAA